MRQVFERNLLVPYLAGGFIVLSLFLQPLDVFIDGLIAIQISKSILLTDYVAIGGIGPALFNSGLLMLVTYLFVRRLDLRITGAIFAGILTIGGFAFFGKNLINVPIIYLGVLLYAKYKLIDHSSVIVVFLFSTGLSPISSVIMFGVGLPLIYSIPLGIIAGVIAGFVLVELSSRVISFHRGYDLYNVGFASGILALAFFSVLRLAGLDYQTNLVYTNDSHILLLVIYIVICLSYLIIGFLLNENSFKGYKDILAQSGRAVTDFTRRNKQAVAMINIGITGLAALGVLLILNIHMNGPVMGGLLTIVGFSAFGKHIRNILPPMIGVVLITLLLDLELSVPIVLAVLFATGLAPVAGEHGIIIGILTGMLHLPVVSSLGQVHGGIVLYSNGFAAAFTAVIMTTFVASFKQREVAPWHYTKK
jgi:hypothetical protein